MEAGETLVTVQRESMCIAADQDSLAFLVLCLALELYSGQGFPLQSDLKSAQQTAVGMCMRSMTLIGRPNQTLLGESACFAMGNAYVHVLARTLV